MMIFVVFSYDDDNVNNSLMYGDFSCFFMITPKNMRYVRRS